jgi:hypothetical protein
MNADALENDVRLNRVIRGTLSTVSPKELEEQRFVTEYIVEAL